jgi:hypothetical protein
MALFRQLDPPQAGPADILRVTKMDSGGFLLRCHAFASMQHVGYSSGKVQNVAYIAPGEKITE